MASHGSTLVNQQTFAERQVRIQERNAEVAIERGYTAQTGVLPEIPSALRVTMAEVYLSHALEGSNLMDKRNWRITCLNFEEYGVRQNYAYEEAIDRYSEIILGSMR
eukprot:906019-Amphidinium_carterae.3